MIAERCVVTVAVGEEYYLSLAKNLLLSFLRWNADSEIHFQLLTDNSGYYSEFKDFEKVHVQQIDVNESDKSFTAKFHLIDFIIAKENLFLDCDCIVYKPLTSVFEKFAGCEFSVIGTTEIEGEFFGNIASIIKRFHITSLPQFVGSLYYYKAGEISKLIFEKARALKEIYDQIGLVRLRNKENEEPLIAIAMALNNQKPLKDDGSVKADYMFFKTVKTNVLNGQTALVRPDSPIISDPAIIHFNDRYSESIAYLSDAFRLKHPGQKLFPELYVLLVYNIPDKFSVFAKQIFRPLYHKLFGVSELKKIKRLS